MSDNQSENSAAWGQPGDEHINRDWLDGDMPTHHAELTREVGRLRRAIAALVAIGAITREKANRAYDIAGW